MLHNRYLFTIIVEHLCNNHIKANTTLVKHKQREFDIIQNKVSCPPLDRATQKIILTCTIKNGRRRYMQPPFVFV